MRLKLSPEDLQSGGLRLLHLGDSYTSAEGISPDQGWPALLYARLAKDGYQLAEPAIIARNGWTTTDLLEAIEADGLEGPFDLITLCIGVNNQYQGLALDDFQEDLNRLYLGCMSRIAGSASTVHILSIPDWGVSPFANDRDRKKISAEIEAFNAVLASLSEAHGFSYIDWTDLSRGFAGDLEAFATDELHPSGKQYAKWADFLYRKLKVE